MNQSDILVVGGGAAGLMTARELSKAGMQVTMLEARDRLGGRIHTLHTSAFTQPAEAGAEFIHGNLAVTMGLMKEAGIRCRETYGEIWRYRDAKLSQRHEFIEQGELLSRHLGELKEDVSITAFLETHFSDPQYTDLRNSIQRFVEGYDAADITRASAFALREEWEGEDEPQYRPEGGYDGMIRFLENECRKNNCLITLREVVNKINWKRGSVEVFTANESVYSAHQLVVTVPLNVLRAQPPQQGAIHFDPMLGEHLKAIDKMGYGSVIKILLEFSTPIWQDVQVIKNTGANMKKAAWIFSAEPVPTWWTQQPDPSGLLTGWIAGPKAETMGRLSDHEILRLSFQSLSTILSLPVEKLISELRASVVCNWTADPFARGAYAYNTLETVASRKTLITPVEDTLYFAGEALHEGPSMGTVEAALGSGQRVAAEILRNSLPG